MKTLYLAFQDKKKSNLWFPLGRLDADPQKPEYRFRYTKGAEQAQKKVGLPTELDFPDLKRDYYYGELFPIFKNRVMSPKRSDFKNYLEHLDLMEKNLDLVEKIDAKKLSPEETEFISVEILAANGGRRVTDTYEVFPKMEKQNDGSFSCRFFLRGRQFVSREAQERIEKLKTNENLILKEKNDNLVVQTEDKQMIGWAPRYLVNEFKAVFEHTKQEPNYLANVVKINLQPAPSQQRILIEVRVQADEYEPMSSKDYQPIID